MWDSGTPHQSLSRKENAGADPEVMRPPRLEKLEAGLNAVQRLQDPLQGTGSLSQGGDGRGGSCRADLLCACQVDK